MATLEVTLPPLAENLDSGKIVDVRIKPGAVVKEGETLLEVDAGKATLEVPAPAAGKVVSVKFKKGDDVKVGEVIAILDAAAVEKDGAGQAPAKASAPPPRTEQPPPPPAPPKETSEVRRAIPIPPEEAATGDATVLAGPATRRVARELGVDLAQVRGSGRDGRVTEEDVKAHVRQFASGSVAVAGPSIKAPPLPNFEQYGPVERQALSPIRKLIARQMSLSWSVIPHVTQHDEADVTELERFRTAQKAQGVKLTITAFVLKACAIALKEYPQFNASLDAASDQLVLKRYYHLGVAVDTENGLLVPVIRNVDQKSVHELAEELVRVAEAARQRKADMTGGTFTISNLGGIGGTAFTPIVNYPEVAILGLSRGREQLVMRDGQVASRLMLPLSLSYDHRVIDGAAAARFTRRLAELLEEPLKMLLHA